MFQALHITDMQHTVIIIHYTLYSSWFEQILSLPTAAACEQIEAVPSPAAGLFLARVFSVCPDVKLSQSQFGITVSYFSLSFQACLLYL